MNSDANFHGATSRLFFATSGGGGRIPVLFGVQVSIGEKYLLGILKPFFGTGSFRNQR